ncbi:MAG: 50S ribosomal protein L25 [Spirochaetaceae bacterium]|jgi:large subunit ribosomal protein L25|nr:50S ribosomal protein L25 [Spirochaetaceae bacterium]
MSQVVFEARKRVGAGSSDARRVRRAGRIPAVIYGRTGSAVTIDLNALEFSTGVKGISGSTIVKVNVDGKTVDAFVKDTQRNILNGQVLHVDYYEVETDKLLRARVPVHITGNPVGVRNGGIFESPLHDIEVESLPHNLPERINVDVSALEVNQSIHVRDLALGDGVRLISGGDQVVALVKFAKAEEAASAVEETAAGTPESAAKEPAKT